MLTIHAVVMQLHHSSDSLEGVRIIIVEDGFALAQSLKYLLTSHGCELVGIAANVKSSLALAADTEFDVAVLDIRLGSDLVTEVASRVHERGKQIVFITGYADTNLLPDHLRGYPLLHKPVDPDFLVETIRGTACPPPSQ